MIGVSPIDFGGVDCEGAVTIEGGRISGFRGGIGEECGTSAPNVIAGVTLTNNAWGVLDTSEKWLLSVQHTAIVGPNGIGGGSGGPTAAGLVQVSHSVIRVTSQTGMLLSDAFVGDEITVDSSRLSGGELHVDGQDGVAITSSRLDDVNAECFGSNISYRDSTIVGGTFWNQACGIEMARDRFIGQGSGGAVSVGDWPGNSVTDSVFTGWATAVGVWGDRAVTITGNTFKGNTVGVDDCDSLSCDAGGGTVTGNRFVDNTGPGLVLHAGTWSVGSNLAIDNGGLGIDAEPTGTGTLTVDDLGGNLARHNLPPQCIGVVCNAHP